MNYIVAGCTDIGNTKNTNQDSYGVKVLNTPLGKMVFAILCDGMGGLAKGEVASSTVVSAFYKWLEDGLPRLCCEGIMIADADIRRDWTQICVDYNEKIKQYGKSNGFNLGTTVTAMLITEQRYFIVNVGDTRAYEISDYVRVITNDQTLVAREVEMGLITAEQAKTDPRRSVLLQCVGASDTVDPDFFFGSTLQNAVYMLCSDGFRHEITDQEIGEYLHPDVMLDTDVMQTNMRTLIDINKQRQERDNITVVSVRTF